MNIEAKQPDCTSSKNEEVLTNTGRELQKLRIKRRWAEKQFEKYHRVNECLKCRLQAFHVISTFRFFSLKQLVFSLFLRFYNFWCVKNCFFSLRVHDFSRQEKQKNTRDFIYSNSCQDKQQKRQDPTNKIRDVSLLPRAKHFVLHVINLS